MGVKELNRLLEDEMSEGSLQPVNVGCVKVHLSHFHRLGYGAKCDQVVIASILRSALSFAKDHGAQTPREVFSTLRGDRCLTMYGQENKPTGHSPGQTSQAPIRQSG